MSRDPRFDAYIKKAPDFAKPILTHVRELVHETCPDVEEGFKWSSPHFTYLGEMMAGMAYFKAHCIFGFWKAPLLDDPKGYLTKGAMGGMGRLTTLKDLPPDRVLKAFIKQAMKLNQEGVKVARGPQKKATALEPQKDLAAALKKNKSAQMNFKEFSPSAQNEYINWIEEAKTEATRTKRLETAIEWISEGKRRHWKYEKK
ncbi:MAG TPA: YdeI/OmpD-associated family protein [Candidatus Kapabacteria bacterium]|jgi:uncharacterized protein YdeI (YjbR/CyaY-like superfamily)|nr:YdeI/OmpD-associated family protein [Candidatus Kapabacteria bacterium]